MAVSVDDMTCKFVRRGMRQRYALMVSKLLFFLICGPYLISTHGMGNKANDTNPSKLVAHPIPSLSYTKRNQS